MFVLDWVILWRRTPSSPTVTTRTISLVATVLAWGAKFSEHPLCIADRHRNGGQSTFAKVLIHRARDLAEDMKVHRIPNADHVVISLLLEPLRSRECAVLRVRLGSCRCIVC